MEYGRINTEILQQFISICGENNVITEAALLQNYSHDYTEDLSFLPEVVAKPSSSEEISSLLKICNKYLIPVTPRGAGTGLSGGALPVFGGLVISMERFNKILDIDERNLQATVEPGVINQVFQEAQLLVVGIIFRHRIRPLSGRNPWKQDRISWRHRRLT